MNCTRVLIQSRAEKLLLSAERYDARALYARVYPGTCFIESGRFLLFANRTAHTLAEQWAF